MSRTRMITTTEGMQVETGVPLNPVPLSETVSTKLSLKFLPLLILDKKNLPALIES